MMATTLSAKTNGAAQEAVAAHLEQHARQDYRPRRRGLHMRVRKPCMNRPHWHFHGEGRKEGDPEPELQIGGEAGEERPIGGCPEAKQHRDIGCPGMPVHCHDGEQHQNGAEQRVEEEFETGVDAALTPPDADDQEHRDQAALEEEIEHD